MSSLLNQGIRHTNSGFSIQSTASTKFDGQEVVYNLGDNKISYMNKAELVKNGKLG